MHAQPTRGFREIQGGAWGRPGELAKISNGQEEMKMHFRSRIQFFPVLILALFIPTATFAQHYIQTNLVSDTTGNPPDGDLINPWGLARSTTSPWWVSDNNTGLSTLYDGTGAKLGLRVVIPAPAGDPNPAAPTGVVFNGSPTDFLVAPQKPALFIFATEDGTIAAWNFDTGAVLKVNHSPEAVYKGITTGDVDGVRFLYVTNFRTGQVEVYNSNFHRVEFADSKFFSAESFDDDEIPFGYAPFNIQNIGGSLVVTYAKQNGARHDDVPGDGFGYVDVYSTAGKLEKRLEHGPWFNAPWGVVWAPRDFGEFSNRLLVGNFGSGWIAAFNGFDGKFIGFMKTFTDPVHQTGEQILTIDGLWAIAFGNSAIGVSGDQSGSAGPYNSLFFTAGPDHEMHGLFGTLTAVPTEQDGDEE
jgi:uncharacterized protein (TIGR03118 family)